MFAHVLVTVAVALLTTVKQVFLDLPWVCIDFLVGVWDHVPTTLLLILAASLHFGTKLIEVPYEYRLRSKLVGVTAWLIYLVIHFLRDRLLTLEEALPFLIQGFLGAVALASALVWTRNVMRVLVRNLRDLSRRRPRRKRAMADLQRAYRQELELIRTASLRSYERRVAREDAKRRYLQRLRQLLES